MLYRIKIVDRGKKRWLIIEADKMKRAAIKVEEDNKGDIADVVVETPFLRLLHSFEDELTAGAAEIWWET